MKRRLKQLGLTAGVNIVTYRIGPEHPDGNATIELFAKRCREMEKPRVLELGTKRVDRHRPSRRDHWIPNAGEYLGMDVEAGPDVDIVADVHRLSKTVGEEQFDVILSCSSFEHFKYPHLAAHEIMKALKVGGVLFIHTHQTFPLHAYPYDYFRFSREALAGCFGTRMGFKVVATDYEFPARVVGRQDPHAALLPAYMYVRLFGEKDAPTPAEFVYELDSCT